MLRLNDIVIKDGTHTIVDRASVSFEIGGLTQIKTTDEINGQAIFNVISGLEKPQHGDIIIDHQNIQRLRESQISWLRSRKIGLIYNTPQLIDNYSVFENIELPLIIIGVPKFRRKARVNELVQEFGLFHDLNKKVSELSVAKKQIVSICRALANDPDFIFADEPTMLLNKNERNFVFSILADIAKTHGKTVVTISYRDMSDEYVDSLITIENKQFVTDNKSNKLRLDDHSIIRKSRIPTMDKLKLAYDDIVGKKARNIFFLMLTSISVMASLLLLLIGNTSTKDFEQSLSDVIEGQQIDVQKVNSSGLVLPMDDNDITSIDSWFDEDVLRGSYKNFTYSIDEVSLVDYALNEEDKILSALKGVAHNSENETWANVVSKSIGVEIKTNYEQFSSSVPPSLKDVEIEKSPSLKETLTDEYERNTWFWKQQKENLSFGKLPQDNPLSDVRYSMTSGPVSIDDAPIAEVLITRELANLILREITISNTFVNKLTSVEELVNRWMLLEMDYRRGVSAYNNTSNQKVPLSVTNIPRTQKASMVKIAGIIEKQIVPSTNIYFTHTHTQNIKNILYKSVTLQNLDSTYPGISESMISTYDYSLVISKLDSIIPISEKINAERDFEMKHRSSNVSIIKNAIDLRNIIGMAGNVLLVISMIVLTSTLALFFLGSKKKINIMKAIGLTKFGVFVNLFIQLIVSLISVHVIANILLIAGIITWNFFQPELVVSFSVSQSINSLIFSFIAVMILGLSPLLISSIENPLQTLKES